MDENFSTDMFLYRCEASEYAESIRKIIMKEGVDSPGAKSSWELLTNVWQAATMLTLLAIQHNDFPQTEDIEELLAYFQKLNPFTGPLA